MTDDDALFSAEMIKASGVERGRAMYAAQAGNDHARLTLAEAGAPAEADDQVEGES